MNEHGLKGKVHDFLTSLKKAGQPVYFRKNWGGKYAGAHRPDYEGCLNGRFFAIELKSPMEKRPTPTPGQALTLREIHGAHGHILVSNDLDEVKDFVHGVLEL